MTLIVTVNKQIFNVLFINVISNVISKVIIRKVVISIKVYKSTF
jgi:hypothetical protein